MKTFLLAILTIVFLSLFGTCFYLSLQLILTTYKVI